MRALIRYLSGRRSGELPPPSRQPIVPQTSMGKLRRAAMTGDREWWRAQDADIAWARQWENDTDRTDPKLYK